MSRKFSVIFIFIACCVAFMAAFYSTAKCGDNGTSEAEVKKPAEAAAPEKPAETPAPVPESKPAETKAEVKKPAENEPAKAEEKPAESAESKPAEKPAVKKEAKQAAENPPAEEAPKKIIANLAHFKYETKRLKEFIVSATQDVPEHENDIRGFLKDVVDASVDGDIGDNEAVALSEAVARILFVLRITDEDRKAKIIKQFAKVMEEADIPRSRINRMTDNAEKVLAILEKKKTATNTDGLIFKYYGIEGKGHQNVGAGGKKSNGEMVKLMNLDDKKDNAPSDIIKKYSGPEEGGKKKKIIGLDLMYPSTGQAPAEDDNGGEAKKDDKKEAGPDKKNANSKIDVDDLFKDKGKNK